MKKLRICYLVYLLLIFNNRIIAQLIVENFDYTAGKFSIVQSNWSKSSAESEANIIEDNLNYIDYTSSGVGNLLEIYTDSSTDYQQSFASVSTGTLYTSFLLKVLNSTGLNSSGDYFMHYKSGVSNCALLKIKEGSTTSVYQLGIGKVSASTAIFASSKELNYNTTYLIVFAYTFNSGTSTDDEVKLWINPSLEGSEPFADIVFTDVNNDVNDLDNLNIRQGANTPNAYLDGIRVADLWASAPLPVELINFEGKVINNKVTLEWETVTEVNNYGFEIERRTSNLRGFQNLEGFTKVGFVNGHGSSNSNKYYSFVDENAPNGELQYRLKQIDFDGAFEYSDVVYITNTPNYTFELKQNYPNPFNPATTISFTIPAAGEGFANLTVYNILGRKVATLVNEVKNPGNYKINFNASKFSSGIYFYTLTNGSFRQTKKMLLTK